MRAACALIATVSTLAACATSGRTLPTSRLPQAFDSTSHPGCYNAAGFFRVSKSDLQRRLPAGFVVRDGSFLGSEYATYGMLVVVYWDCPRPTGGSDGFAIIATPIEDPGFSLDLRPVRWNWYEFGRVADDRRLVQRARDQGLTAQLATLSHPPFHEGDRKASFAATVPGGQLFEVRAALTDSVNFQAQSHRFWHARADGHLVSTRMDFGYHHSWVGQFDACSFQGKLLATTELSSIECTGVGVTETIERLPMSEHVIQWY